MDDALKKHGVIPDVIDKVPPGTLHVVYPNNLVVETGKVLVPYQVRNPPMVKWADDWAADPGTYYTLCMTDPDSPSRQNPKYREWHHWLVGNILGDDVGNGEVLSEYIGACPLRGTGLHRYVFVLYEQPNKLIFNEKHLTDKSAFGRGNFSIRTFAKKYALGDPIAANMYQAEYDYYVPNMYQRFNF